MPAFVPRALIKLECNESLAPIHNLFNGQKIAVMIPGKSIEELEQRIEEFANYNLIWISLNRFDVMQKHILDKINQHLSFVMDIGEVQYAEDYEKQIRIPRWINYLQRHEQNILVTSEEIITELKNLNLYEQIEQYQAKIITIKGCRKLQVPNSISVYFLFLAHFAIQKLILFGFDGFGTKSAFRDTPLWNAELMHCPFISESINSYYHPEYVLEERRIGYQDEEKSDLHSNAPTTNDQILLIYRKYCRDNNLNPTYETINCSPQSLYTIFRKTDYATLQKELT